MKFISALFIAFYSSIAFADNYRLEGTLQDGTIMGYESDPPGYVYVKQKNQSGQYFEGEMCGFNDSSNIEERRKTSYFSCADTGKSPLAGTKYKFKRHVGNNCEKQQDDHDIYTCVSGCSIAVPKELIQGGYCAP